MCSASPPPPPDVIGQANAQGAANRETAQVQGRINNPNVIGPFGNRTITWNGDTPTITSTLSPQEQHLQEQRWSTASRLGEAGQLGAETVHQIIGKPVDFSGAARAPTSYVPDARLAPTQTPEALDQNQLPAMPAEAAAVRDKVIAAMMSRAEDDIGKRQEQVQSDLVARGLRPGTEAYAREMDTLNRQRNDAKQQAEIAGGDAAAQAFGMDMARRSTGTAEQAQRFQQELSGGAQNFQQRGSAAQLSQSQQAQANSQQAELRRTQIAEMLAQRQVPLNEIIGLMGKTQVGASPAATAGGGAGGGFNPTNVAPPPLFAAGQAQNQYQTDVYNAQASQANTNNQALASAAMMIAMY
jgi:hypothetical protein